MKPFETVRAAVLRIYRLASVPVLAALVLAGLDALGVFGRGEWPESFYTLAVLLLMGSLGDLTPIEYAHAAGNSSSELSP